MHILNSFAFGLFCNRRPGRIKVWCPISSHSIYSLDVLNVFTRCRKNKIFARIALPLTSISFPLFRSPFNQWFVTSYFHYLRKCSLWLNAPCFMIRVSSVRDRMSVSGWERERKREQAMIPMFYSMFYECASGLSLNLSVFKTR